jgi:hypothetical protein
MFISGVATAGHLGQMHQLKINNLPFLTLFFYQFCPVFFIIDYIALF